MSHDFLLQWPRSECWPRRLSWSAFMRSCHRATRARMVGLLGPRWLPKTSGEVIDVEVARMCFVFLRNIKWWVMINKKTCLCNADVMKLFCWVYPWKFMAGWKLKSRPPVLEVKIVLYQTNLLDLGRWWFQLNFFWGEFSPGIPGEMIQFDDHIVQMGGLSAPTSFGFTSWNLPARRWARILKRPIWEDLWEVRGEPRGPKTTFKGRLKMAHSKKCIKVLFLSKTWKGCKWLIFSESAQQDAREVICFFDAVCFFLLLGAQDGQEKYPAALAKGSAPLNLRAEMAHAV